MILWIINVKKAGRLNINYLFALYRDSVDLFKHL